ncbi:hypothetical protein A2957_02025 [Candidatus Roizmanbacteria bacterium RIFCSPLOWO2_01_FULL_38_11]|uniref:Aminoglycoside phosphotransferase domain-containing protein n=1 Tax=Candidatus Roizmanbacteria bacterium RIFCSPLOWO2_01_FULL_38_11 TaxID=1802060 RepID=A0A1F7IM75_9BACT|nr:MAG: hypothetical protein A2957_02025 [Candidatus Roizmanbacteria bacterium RIFCSPLOWO2_01_FULL_38_11]
MPKHHLESSQLTDILKKYNLGELISTKEIATGLINPVYLINENLILRLDLEKHENLNKFEREAILYELLPKFNIPTPHLIACDESKNLLDVAYMLMSYIPGENLSQSFKKLNEEQKKELSFELGKLAKQIHSIKPEDIGHEDLFKNIDSWIKWTMSDFETQWHVVSKTDHLSQQEKDEITLTF